MMTFVSYSFSYQLLVISYFLERFLLVLLVIFLEWFLLVIFQKGFYQFYQLFFQNGFYQLFSRKVSISYFLEILSYWLLKRFTLERIYSRRISTPSLADEILSTNTCSFSPFSLRIKNLTSGSVFSMISDLISERVEMRLLTFILCFLSVHFSFHFIQIISAVFITCHFYILLIFKYNIQI